MIRALSTTLRVLGWLLPGLGLAGCSARPYYTGPGSYGTTLPYQAHPVWGGHDTTATYVSAYGSTAIRYNERDKNVAFSGQLHRAWVRENFRLTAGVFGGGGRYTYRANSEAPPIPPLARLQYGVAGVQIGGTLSPNTTRPRGGVEARILTVKFALAREWGEVATWRKQPTDATTGLPLTTLADTRAPAWLQVATVGPEFVLRPTRPRAPTVGLGAGLQFRNLDLGVYGSAFFGVGPLMLTAVIIAPVKYSYRGDISQFGLSYQLPHR